MKEVACRSPTDDCSLYSMKNLQPSITRSYQYYQLLLLLSLPECNPLWIGIIRLWPYTFRHSGLFIMQGWSGVAASLLIIYTQYMSLTRRTLTMLSIIFIYTIMFWMEIYLVSVWTSNLRIIQVRYIKSIYKKNWLHSILTNCILKYPPNTEIWK
jgi:hypothetical protein